MKPRQQVSRAAIELLKTFEGYRQKAAQLPDGRWTIGYGHALTAREGAVVSPADAEALLLYDLIGVAHAVNEAVFTPLSQNQFDALCCFAFNIGVENFRRSAALRRVNEGSLLQAAYAMEMWRRADVDGERIVIDALVRRRAAEKALFLTPEGGWVAAPSPVLPPKIDFDIEAFALRERPTEVRTPLDGARAVAERDGRPATGLSAAEQAAAAVGARLQSLLPDTAPGPQAPIVAFAEPGPQELSPGLIAEPAELHAEASVAPTAEATDLSPSASERPETQGSDAPPPESPPQDEDADATTAAEPPAAPPLAAEAAPDAGPPLVDPNAALLYGPTTEGGFHGWRLMLLGMVGLAVFAGGLFQGLNGSAGVRGALATPAIVGWALALAGAMAFGLAAYGLLRDLGDDAEIED
jgi:lysozyme